MFLVVFVTVALSIVGLFSQVVGLQSTKMYNSQTTFADVMMTWHSASVQQSKTLPASIFTSGGGCSLTPQQCQQVSQQQCSPVTTQQCGPVTTQQCAPVTTTVCNPVTTQSCTVQKQCTPQQQCTSSPCTGWGCSGYVTTCTTVNVCNNVNVCTPVTTTVCSPVTTTQCTNVTNTVCQNVTNTVCTPISVTSCAVGSTTGTNTGLSACTGNTAGTSGTGSSVNYSLPPGYTSAYNFYSIAFQGAPFAGAGVNDYILTYVGGAGSMSHTNTLLMRDGTDSGFSTGDLINQLSREDKKDLAYGVVQLSGTQHVLTGRSKIVGEFSYNVPSTVPVGSVAILSVAN